MARALRDFQIADGDYIALRSAALIAHEPRVGKTNIAIRAADLVEAKLVVIVCPASVINNWRLAVEEFRDGLWTAVIVSYNKADKVLSVLRKREIDVLIVDESHYCKERGAGRTKVVFGTMCDRLGGLAERAKHVYCLTGTPLPNNPTELWPMLRALAPHLIKDDNGNPMSWYTFRDRYCKTINTGYGVKVVGAKNYRELREKLKDFMIRRTRREVFGRDLLPPTNVYVTADTSTAKQVEALQNSEQGQLVMAALQSGNPLKALAKAEKQIAKLRKLFGLAKVPGVAKMISEELDAEPGSKIVLFGYHHDTIDALRNALKKYGAVSFDGRTPPARKVALNKKFMTDPNCRVIVGQLQAMGVGLDFSISDNTLFVEWSYVGDENGQAMSRIFNMNSPEPKFTRFAVLAGSLDAQIAAAATSKLKDSALILGGRTTL